MHRVNASRVAARRLWEEHHGTPIPAGYVIHHEDHNPLNNAIENLTLLSKTTHAALHGYARKGVRTIHHREPPVQITAVVPGSMKEAIQRIAQERRVSTSYLMRRILRDWLAEQSA